MKIQYRPDDVVQVMPGVIFEREPVGLSVCVVGDCIYGAELTDLVLSRRSDNRTLLLTSNEVRFIRRGKAA